MTIQELGRQQIDDRKWNAAVAADPSRLPYGYTWWLDAVTDRRWRGLVIQEYRLVLPLPLRWRFGRWTRVQRPPFTQQCGPFGDFRPGDLAALLRRIPAGTFSLPLVAGLPATEIPQKYLTQLRTNLVLDLSQSAERIHQGYNRSLRRQLRPYPSAELTPASPELVIALYRDNVGDKAGLRATHYRAIRRLMEATLQNDAALLLRADDPEAGLLAAGFFPHHRGRLINLFGASSPTGYRCGGMARLLAGLIDEYAQRADLLDFEGSDLPGVAGFFRGFGPEERNYLTVTAPAALRRNR